MDGVRTVARMCVVLAVACLAKGRANAADLDGPPVVETEAAPAPQPPASTLPLLDERTAYTVGRHRLKLGILAFEFGIIDQVSVGTDPPAWALRSFTSILVPNLHVKFKFFERGPVTLAALAAVYYAHLTSGDSAGQLFDVPLSLYASIRPKERLFFHLEGTYVYAHIIGAGDLSSGSVNGAAANNAIQTALMVEYRLTHIFSILVSGRVQPYETNVTFDVTHSPDPATTFQLNGEVVPRVKHPWQVLAGVAFLWTHFHLTLGVGYGNYFVPGMDIAVPKQTIVPDASLSVLL